jgi:hypothetical protein
LGSLAKDTGNRPSDLVSWTDEEDWFNRLMFDFNIMNAYHDAENKAMKKASKR